MGQRGCSNVDVRGSGPCLEQITDTSRAVPSSALSYCEEGNEPFVCATSESLPDRENIASQPHQPSVSEGQAVGKEVALPALDISTFKHKSSVSVSVDLIVFATK